MQRQTPWQELSGLLVVSLEYLEVAFTYQKLPKHLIFASSKQRAV